jgi:hypothetical protein
LNVLESFLMSVPLLLRLTEVGERLAGWVLDTGEGEPAQHRLIVQRAVTRVGVDPQNTPAIACAPVSPRKLT